MSKASRDGYYGEKKVEAYLSQAPQLKHVERYGHQGPQDKADFRGMKQFAVDSKYRVGWDFASWTKRLDEQIVNASARFGFVVKPQKGKPVDDWYFVTKGRYARSLIALIESLEDEHIETFLTELTNALNKEKKERVKTKT